MHRDIVFRGCTRPPMFLGVPYVPFFLAAGGCLLIAMYVDLRLLVLVPLAVFLLRQVARRDEQVFRLLGLRWQMRPRVRNLGLRSGDWVFSPHGARTRSRGR